MDAAQFPGRPRLIHEVGFLDHLLMEGRYQAWHKDALGVSIMPAHVCILQGRESLHFDPGC